MNSNHIKRIDSSKSVEYDDKEDVYYVKSVTTGEKYKVNKLKDIKIRPKIVINIVWMVKTMLFNVI